MLTISVELNKSVIIPYCKDFKTPYNGGVYLYTAVNNSTLLGAGLFEISGNEVTFWGYHTLENEDYFLFDGIIRAGFNYASEYDIITGIIPENIKQEFKNFFEKLNYPNENSFNIENFFTKYKNCSI